MAQSKPPFEQMKCIALLDMWLQTSKAISYVSIYYQWLTLLSVISSYLERFLSFEMSPLPRQDLATELNIKQSRCQTRH